MERLKDKMLYAFFGVAGGTAGFLPFTACSGSPCAACPGCAGMAVSMALILLVDKLNKRSR